MTSRDVEDFFSHGGEYVTDGAVRATCCGSCAFSSSPDSVRGDRIGIDDLVALTCEYDDFVCHTPNGDGRHSTCSGWAAHRR